METKIIRYEVKADQAFEALKLRRMIAGETRFRV